MLKFDKYGNPYSLLDLLYLHLINYLSMINSTRILVDI